LQKGWEPHDYNVSKDLFENPSGGPVWAALTMASVQKNVLACNYNTYEGSH